MPIPSLSPSRFPGLSLAAWAIIHVVTNQSVSIVKSSGISGVVRMGLGDYQFTLATPISNADMAFDVSVIPSAIIAKITKTENTVRVATVNRSMQTAEGDGFYIGIYA